MNFLLGVLKTN